MTDNLTGIRWFFESNDTSARLLRTIVQGVLAVACSAVTYYANLGPEWVSIVVAPLIMAILSPIMGAIGGTLDKESIPAQNVVIKDADETKIGGSD